MSQDPVLDKRARDAFRRWVKVVLVFCGLLALRVVLTISFGHSNSEAVDLVVGPLTMVMVALFFVSFHLLVKYFRAWRNSNGHFTAKERFEYHLDIEQSREKPRARPFRELLLDSHPIPALTLPDVELNACEEFYLSGMTQYARFYDPKFSHSDGDGSDFGPPATGAATATGNLRGGRNTHLAKEKAARPQWQDAQWAEIRASNQRLMIRVSGLGWVSFYYWTMRRVVPKVEQQMLIIEFDHAEPLRLRGPIIPAISNLVVLHTQGLDALQFHPNLKKIDSW